MVPYIIACFFRASRTECCIYIFWACKTCTKQKGKKNPTTTSLIDEQNVVLFCTTQSNTFELFSLSLWSQPWKHLCTCRTLNMTNFNEATYIGKVKHVNISKIMALICIMPLILQVLTGISDSVQQFNTFSFGCRNTHCSEQADPRTFAEPQ